MLINLGNIVILDDLTINKIAAGEVIERPASVVKEMVENSIDAGATNINVEIKNGGISYIRITDNGKGIEKEDMELAFERHATSKLRQASDLDNITSMGFRGEALASIAAIAKVTMVSRTKDAEIGYKIVVEGGNIIEAEETGCPLGTTITVENLFFNTPVRYKFLKKDYTESGYIEDAITRLALVNTEISFRLINSGKTIIQTAGDGNIQNIIYGIYGKDIASGIVSVDYIYDDITIKGVVGKPEIARSNRSNQLFFINNRYVKDKILSGAVEQAFKGMLPIGKYGFLVLNIQIEPNKVDVNVHPAKLEVRFQEENKIFKAVYHAIKEALLKTELVANTEKQTEDKVIENFEEANKIEDKKEETPKYSFSNLFKRKEETKITENKPIENNISSNNLIEDLYNSKKNVDNVVLAEEKQDYNIAEEVKNLEKFVANARVNKPQENEDNVNEFEQTKPIQIINDEETEEQELIDSKVVEEAKVNTGEIWAQIVQENVEMEADVPSEEIIDKKTENFDAMYENIFGTAPKKEENEEAKVETITAYDVIKDNNISVFENNEQFIIPNYKFIGIAFSTYIIIEMNKELYIIDQHAAHERIMYEKVKENFYKEEDKDSQMLLLPDVITLTHKEMDIAKENIDIFEKAGFELEEFGDNTIKLTGVPNICIELDTKELFLETLDEINTVALTAKQEKEEKFIATVACKAAVKANMALTEAEVSKLMEQLLKLPNPFTCPHGRPTAIKMDKNDIEKKFARRK